MGPQPQNERDFRDGTLALTNRSYAEDAAVGDGGTWSTPRRSGGKREAHRASQCQRLRMKRKAFSRRASMSEFGWGQLTRGNRRSSLRCGDLHLMRPVLADEVVRESAARDGRRRAGLDDRAPPQVFLLLDEALGVHAQRRERRMRASAAPDAATGLLPSRHIGRLACTIRLLTVPERHGRRFRARVSA